LLVAGGWGTMANVCVPQSEVTSSKPDDLKKAKVRISTFG